MKGSITITFNANEAVAILASNDLPKSVVSKVVSAFRVAAVQPQGAKAATLAAAPKPKKSKKSKKYATASTDGEETGTAFAN